MGGSIWSWPLVHPQLSFSVAAFLELSQADALRLTFGNVCQCAISLAGNHYGI